PGWRFAGTVLLQELHYRYKVVDRILHPDPVLVALEGLRAILEVEVLRSPEPIPPDSPEEAAARALVDAGASGAAGPLGPAPTPPARAMLDGDLLEKVRVQPLGRGEYEINTADVESLLENAGRVLADLEPFVMPTLSLKTGFQYQVTSAAADGVLSRQGFTVTAPKLAERAGLQVGDTILNVNGQPVDGFASLYRIFQAVRRDSALRTVQVELERRGSRLTQTYRIR
ncbi:MAG TPA: PDZ domain-containing protein, partial [Candidatus Methylomirabilis sp.]|nr:PDZ domain-containing protein [Candidatus Methylomirabilis sp.]